MEGELVKTLPGFRIHLRVGNRHGELHIVMVHAMKALLDPQILAMRTTGVIEPASGIQTDRLDHERVVIHPFSDGVSVPPRLGVFGEFPPIRPNDSPIAVPSI